MSDCADEVSDEDYSDSSGYEAEDYEEPPEPVYISDEKDIMAGVGELALYSGSDVEGDVVMTEKPEKKKRVARPSYSEGYEVDEAHLAMANTLLDRHLRDL